MPSTKNFKVTNILLFILLPFVSIETNGETSFLPNRLTESMIHFQNHTGISDFRLLNRRKLLDCPDPDRYIQINVPFDKKLSNDELVTVNVTGVSQPSNLHWVAMISPSHSDVETCLMNAIEYVETGDLSNLPLLCHYPVKAQYMSNDPDYLSCEKHECKTYEDRKCVTKTCGATLTFHVVNIRTDIEFVVFGGGFRSPCLIKRSKTISFANPNTPLYGHISSIDSTSSSMKLTWVSGDKTQQQVQYGKGKTTTSSVSTFTQKDMCNGLLQSPAFDFGWHDPGYIHSAVMKDLNPSTTYSYKYGSDSVGWSDEVTFKTPPVSGSDEVKFLAFGDMGKAPLDSSVEHYIQPGSVPVIKAMAEEVSSGGVDSIFHIGDISYATGFLVEWEFFLQLISPLASRVPYMTAIGNHERDFVDSGSIYTTPDSGGECGVPYETYFQMPTQSKDKPWYSIEQGSVHFTVISTEHNWSVASEQHEWMKKDMASVNRSRTPWLIFAGHRPMYTSNSGNILFPSVDNAFVEAVEPLLLANKVDLALFGHVHNYERTCAVYQQECKALPVKDAKGIDTYNASNYTAPVHAVIGMAGFKLDGFTTNGNSWSLVRKSEFGYLRVHSTKKELRVEFQEKLVIGFRSFGANELACLYQTTYSHVRYNLGENQQSVEG